MHAASTARRSQTPPKEERMLVAANATFWDFLWALIVIYFLVWFFIILFRVVVDVFRRDDASAGKKILWLLFLVFVPFLGVLIYILVNNDGMMERSL
jgi:Phospholipase_D-nuclease N-terminal